VPTSRTHGGAKRELDRLEDGFRHGSLVVSITVHTCVTSVIERRVAFSRRYDVQQGNIHGIVVPHVLQYVFDQTAANRTVIADGLGIDAARMTEEEVAAESIGAVEAVRDSLDLPTRLRELDPTCKADLPAIAEFIVDDIPMDNAPVGLNPTVDEIEAILENAW